MSSRRLFGLVLGVAIGLWALPAAHAGSVFVQVDGVTGGAIDPTHKGWLNAASYSFSLTAPGPVAEKVRPVFAPLKVVLYADVGMPGLVAAHGRSTTIPSLTIQVMGVAGPQGTPVFQQIKLTNARVLDLTIDGPADSSPQIAASFTYDGIDFELRPPLPRVGEPLPLKSGYTISTGAVR